MKTLRNLVFGIAWAIACAQTLAGGALSFTATPSVVHSGDANSWMNGFSDWDQVALASGAAVPNLPSKVDLTTSRTASDLIFDFTIHDRTHKKSNGDPLIVGDQIIVEIDTNATRLATLTAGKSFRYKIVIGAGAGKTNQISGANVAAPGPGNNWIGSTALTVPAVGSACPASYPNGCAMLSLAGDDYVVELRVPLSSIGLPSVPVNDIGLAILVSNDLGHTQVLATNTGNKCEGGLPTDNICDQTAVSFSFADMPAGTDPFDDPGLVNPSTNGMSNIWNMPNHWGAGIFSTPAEGSADLSLSHSPQPYFSNSIRLSLCNIGRFEDVGPADATGNQVGIPGWYKYERDAPCKMGIWVAVTNSSEIKSAAARLLVLWGDGGLATNNWRVVALTDPINFGPSPKGCPGASDPCPTTTHVVWDQVPSKGSVPGGSTHPCLRVYLVKASLASTEEAAIRGIHDGATLNAWASAFGFGVDLVSGQVAQMNFTNLFSGTCSNPLCSQVVVGSNQDFRQRLLGMMGIRSAFAQPRSPAPVNATPFDPKVIPEPSKDKDPWFGVVVHGFVVSTSAPTLPYRFVQAIGGIAWAVPYTLVAGEDLTLGFGVTNPPTLYRDLTTSPPRDFPAPKRRVLLSVAVNAPAGMPKPNITINGSDGEFEPGAGAPATIVVRQTAGGSNLPAWIRCLLAGNLWCWLILLLLLLLFGLALRAFLHRKGP